MKLYSYVVKNDVGFAPNPFWGYCTLAACTPNHMGIHLEPDDWLVGTANASRDYKLIYAMCVSEVLHFDEYYRDERFERKKPVLRGTPRQQCGDNIYFTDTQRQWQQHPARYHCEDRQKIQDVKHPFVFIAEHFYYFGKKAVSIPTEFSSLVWKRQGVKSSHETVIVEGFLDWLQTSFKPGINGEPFDMVRDASC